MRISYAQNGSLLCTQELTALQFLETWSYRMKCLKNTKHHKFFEKLIVNRYNNKLYIGPLVLQFFLIMYSLHYSCSPLPN